jgi:predicted ATP-binding protein involved in virulence
MQETNVIYEAVKNAITNCVQDLEDIFYSIRRDDLLATFTDERTLPFGLLSEGFRNMLAMVADIAHRAAILNPHLEVDVAQKAPGIVLIDEIDLHLHPRWQRRVVEDLRRTFPRMQFIATTHSPFIIQSLRPGELVDLNKGPTGEYVNRSIEDITESVMGIEVPQRSERYNQMFRAAQEYYRVLEQAEGASQQEINRLKQKLDELVEPFSDNVAYHAFLQMERIAAGLDGDNDDEAN